MMRKALSIFFAVLLLISNLGLTLSTHYCGGIAVNTQLVMGNYDLNCGMEIQASACDTNEQTTFRKSSCCDNEHLRIQLDDEYKHQIQITDLDVSDLIAFVPNLPQLNCELPTSNSSPTPFYNPPPLIQDIPVLHQVFLI